MTYRLRHVSYTCSKAINRSSTDNLISVSDHQHKTKRV